MYKMVKILLVAIIMSHISYANEIIVKDQGLDVKNVTIRGNGEECTITYKIPINENDIRYVDTNCKSLINSKGIEIFCTKKKKICKTDSEINNALTSNINATSSLVNNKNKDVTFKGSNKGTLLEKLASIKEPTTHTYASMRIKNHGLTIWMIKQTEHAIKIYFKKNNSNGKIAGNPIVCTKYGFIGCKQKSNLLFYIRTDENSNVPLSKIYNFTMKDEVLERLKRMSESSSYANHARKRWAREAKAYKNKVIPIKNDNAEWFKLEELASSGFALHFPYNGKQLKKFDLLEGYDGSWNFRDIRLPNFSDQEKTYQNKLLKILNSSKEELVNLSDSDLQSLVKKYDKYNEVSEYISKELLNKVQQENNIELRLAKYINNNATHEQNSLQAVKELKSILAKKRDLELYNSVFNVLDLDNPYILPLADDMTRVIWEDRISTSTDIAMIIQFISDFKGAPGDIIADAHGYALELESKRIHDKFDNMLKENSGQLSKFDAQERLARRLYIEAVQAKEDKNYVEFTVKYKTAITDPLLNETEAAFNLYRDKEMKDFFTGELAALNKNQRESTMELVQSINGLGQTLDVIASNTNVVEQSQAEIDAQNQRFLMQGFIFDKVHRRDDDN